MTLKEAWEEIKKLLDNNVKEEDIPPEDFDHYDFALDIVDDFIEKSEQAPTLEKLGYVRDKAKEEVIKEAVRIYKGNGYTIEFIEDGEISIGKWDCDYDCSPMTVPELLACAEVIKEMEKEEKMKRKEETK